MKIEKNIPIKPIRTHGKAGQYREIIANMEESDSVGDLTQNQSTALAQLMRKNGIKAVSRKMTGSKADVNETIYRVWHDGLLETAEEQGKQRIGSPTNTVGITPGILQQAEAHEDKHNIVEDTREVLKIANEELAEIKKKEKGK